MCRKLKECKQFDRKRLHGESLVSRRLKERSSKRAIKPSEVKEGKKFQSRGKCFNWAEEQWQQGVVFRRDKVSHAYI